MNLNDLTMTGNLVKKASMSTIGNNVLKATFNLAVDRKISKEKMNNDDVQKVDYIPCEAYGKYAEIVEKYTNKGDKVLIKGELHIDRGEENKSYTKVIINYVELLEGKNE